MFPMLHILFAIERIKQDLPIWRYVVLIKFLKISYSQFYCDSRKIEHIQYGNDNVSRLIPLCRYNLECIHTKWMVKDLHFVFALPQWFYGEKEDSEFALVLSVWGAVARSGEGCETSSPTRLFLLRFQGVSFHITYTSTIFGFKLCNATRMDNCIWDFIQKLPYIIRHFIVKFRSAINIFGLINWYICLVIHVWIPIYYFNYKIWIK